MRYCRQVKNLTTVPSLQLEADICKVMDWFEDKSSLWVVVVTGTGRAFCAGQGECSFVTPSPAVEPSRTLLGVQRHRRLERLRRISPADLLLAFWT